MSVVGSPRTLGLLLFNAALLVVLLGDRQTASRDGSGEAVATHTPSTTNAIVDGEQELELIPAIFARNSRVRFVFDRHVSKWM